jgi:hypothetical protein
LGDDFGQTAAVVDAHDLHPLVVQVADLVIEHFLFGEDAELLGDALLVQVGQVVQYALALDVFGEKLQVADDVADIGGDHASGQVDVQRLARFPGVALGGVVAVVVHSADDGERQAERQEDAQESLQQIDPRLRCGWRRYRHC